MKQLLLKLCDAFGVSGNEDEAGRIIADEIKDFVDEIYSDPIGNVIAFKKSRINKHDADTHDASNHKIMLFAHMDEQGLLATFIDEKGFVRFSPLGDFTEAGILGARVKFSNGVHGIIECDGANSDTKSIKMSQLFVDIGASSKEQAMQAIKIGDVACFDNASFGMQNRVFAKALDNRTGCAVLVETAKKLKDNKSDVYFVFTSQEKIGQRGAKPAAYYVNPDIAIMIDIASANDAGGSSASAIKCGRGPVVRIKDKSCIYHPDVRRRIEETAKHLNISIQYEVNEKEVSDAGIVCQQAGAIACGAILVPVRYCSRPVGMVDINDIEDTVKIITKFLS